MGENVISRFKPRGPSPALVVSVVALFAAIGGGTAWASGAINGSHLVNGSVHHSKLSGNSVWHKNIGTNSVWHANLGRGVVQANNLSQSVKPTFESQQSCTPDLCIDAAPGPDGSAGSGGWGWNSTTKKPVTDLTAGSTNGLTVTVLQPNNEVSNGTITLTYDPYDFSYVSNGDTGATCKQASYPAVSCTYTDLAHSSKSDSFQFKALHDDPYAVVTATADAAGQQATASFPVAITG